MIQFNINSDSLKRLKKLSDLSSKFEKTSDGVLLTLTEDKLTPHIYGNKSIVEFSIDIQNFSAIEDNGIRYIKADFSKFNQAADKCNIDDNGILVKIDTVKNVITTYPANGQNPKITINCYDAVDKAQADLIMEDWELRKQAPEFTSNTIDILCTNQILTFAEEASKFMSISGTTNAIGLSKNNLYYADRFSVIKKTTDETFTNTDEMIKLSKGVCDFLKSIYKEGKADVPITVSASREFIRIVSAETGIRAVIWAGDIQLIYPNQEEYEMIIPEPNVKKSFKVNKAELIKAFGKFDGIFSPTEYRWKQINFVNKDEPKLYLEYSDYSAEVNTDVEISVTSDTLSEKEFQFQIAGLVLSKIIDLIDEDEITFEYSNEASSEPHGFGISVISPTLEAVCTKLNADD